jgi:hypothetical protein
MSNNPPPYGPPPGGGQPYGPPPGGGQPYGQPQQGPGPYGPPPGGPQPAFGTPYGGAPAYGFPPAGPTKKFYQRWWFWLLVVIALLVIAGIIWAYFRGNKYALESKIKDVEKDRGHTVADVNCPDSINTDSGHTYICTATLDGQPRQLLVDFVEDKKFTVTP